MDNKKASRALLVLLFMPVVLAIVGIVIDFNVIDFVYLLLVGMIFLKYIFTAKE